MAISSFLGSSALLPAGLGFRNKIINGGFDVWQRGTPVTTSGAYTADRWAQVSGNSIVHTQSTDVPNAGFGYSMSVAGTGSNICQRIESLNCGGINGTITVSFWYKSTAGSDPLSMSLYYCNTTDSFGSVTQIGSNVTVASSPSSSWTYYTYTFNGVSSNAKNGVALYLFRGFSATSTTLITGVQVEANSMPTPFEQRPYGVELALCQRYFYVFKGVSNNYNAVSTTGIMSSTTNLARSIIMLPVPMRRAIVSADLSFEASALTAYDASGLATVSAITAYGNSTQYITSDVSCAGLTQFRPACVLTNNGYTTGLSVSTEL